MRTQSSKGGQFVGIFEVIVCQEVEQDGGSEFTDAWDGLQAFCVFVVFGECFDCLLGFFQLFTEKGDDCFCCCFDGFVFGGGKSVFVSGVFGLELAVKGGQPFEFGVVCAWGMIGIEFVVFE